jgi:hypothetical protein
MDQTSLIKNIKIYEWTCPAVLFFECELQACFHLIDIKKTSGQLALFKNFF